MYMLCMVGSGNGASNWAEMLIGHVWGGQVVGTTCFIDDEILTNTGLNADYAATSKSILNYVMVCCCYMRRKEFAQRQQAMMGRQQPMKLMSKKSLTS